MYYLKVNMFGFNKILMKAEKEYLAKSQTTTNT